MEKNMPGRAQSGLSSRECVRALSIHQPADTAFKSLFQSKRAFIQLLRYFLKTPWVDLIDEQQMERIDKSYIKSDHARLESDVVYKCRMKDQVIIIYVLLEMQSTVDYQMPWRLLQAEVEVLLNGGHS